MPTNGNLSIEQHFVEKGTREETKQKLLLVRLTVTEKEGPKRRAIVYLGRSDNGSPYEISRSWHLQPFNGQRAAEAACSKAIKNIKKAPPETVIAELAQM